MIRRIAALTLTCCCLALASGGVAQAAFLPPMFSDHRPQPDLVFTYHGWRVDASRTAKTQKPAKTVKAINAQIDIVEHVGLAPGVLTFMRSLPIIALPNAGAEPDAYIRGRGILLHLKGLDDRRPVVLRLLLYAYQDQVLPGGASNADVARFRGEATAKHVWPNTAAMLRSDQDYFAITASAYLYGAITREPYTRADLRKTQPDAYAWLARRFDGGKARSSLSTGD